MKKLSYLVAIGMVAGAIVILPTKAVAQDEKQLEFERNFYDVCYTKKDKAACLPLAKELREKYSSSQYKKFADQIILKDLNEKFTNALNAFYAGPDGPKLDQLVRSSDEYLVEEKGQTAITYVVTRVALAQTYGSMSNIYKDTERARANAEKALQLMSSPTPPEGWDKKDYDPLRDTAMAQLNQYLGYQILQKEGDAAHAVEYLNKSAAVKHKDGLGWKDPNNYFLRSNATFQQYQKLSKEYQALPDDKKTGDEGKALLAKINPTIDKMIADYARVLATATNPNTKQLKDGAKEQFDQFWKYRTGADTGGAEYIKKYEADPTIPDVPVPAKPETTDTPAAGAPPVGSANAPKLTTAVSASPVNGGSNGSSKAAPAAKSGKSGKGGKRKP